MSTITCRQAHKMMSLKLDTLLSLDKDLLLQNHLATCVNCEAQWTTLELLVGRLAQPPLVAPPADFVTKVMARTRAATNPQAVSPKQVLSMAFVGILLGAVSVGMLCLLCVVMGLFNFPQVVSAISEASQWTERLSAVLTLPHAILVALRNIVGAAFSTPWPAVASAISALSTCLLLVWVYLVLRLQGAQFGRLFNNDYSLGLGLSVVNSGGHPGQKPRRERRNLENKSDGTFRDRDRSA